MDGQDPALIAGVSVALLVIFVLVFTPSRGRKACPRCERANAGDAVVCRYCDAEF